jgi:glycosyltransferase involved in cell wall biosynthesis
MNVLMCITGLNKGGAEKMLCALCTRTAAYGHTFVPVVASFIGGHYAGVLREAGVETHIIIRGASPLSVIRSLLRYFRFLRSNRNRIDIIHAFLADGGFLALASKLIVRKPLIYSVRNSTQRTNENRVSVRYWMRTLFHVAAIRNAALVTCNSPYIKQLLSAEQKCDAEVIMNAVEKPDKARYTDEAIRAAYFSDRAAYHVVSVCNMRYPQKDIITLLHVAKKLDAVRFVLVGDGTHLTFFKDAAASLVLSNVTFAGYQENVYPFFTYSRCYVLLARHEGFPNTVLEAMISEIPVVMSDIPEVRGVLVNGENSLLVKNGDVESVTQAITLIKSDPLVRQRIMSAAYTMVSKTFSYENMIRDNFKTYTRVVNGNS